MSKKNIFLFILMLAFLVLVGGYSLYRTFLTFGQLRASTAPTGTAPEKQEKVMRPTIVTYACRPEKTVLELLNETASDVKVREFAFGTQVLAINGLEQGEGKFWFYSIDDKDATVAANLYTCQDDEQIRWELK